MIKLIWAMDENWLVGKDNKLPWRIEEDLKFFQKMTKNKIVLMGNNNYESMKYYYKNKSFPFKKTYVASRSNKKYKDAELVNNLDSFLKENKDELFVIGGPSIYKQSLKYANVLYITFILDTYKGDTFFPKFDLEKFNLINYSTSNKLIFAKYERRN